MALLHSPKGHRLHHTPPPPPPPPPSKKNILGCIKQIFACVCVGGQKNLWALYWLNCSHNLATDLPMVCKFKFIRYGCRKQNSAYMPLFDFAGLEV